MGIGSRVVRTHLKKASRAVVKNMFRFEPFVRSRQGYLFWKSGHRIFPDSYHDGTDLLHRLDHVQTRYQVCKERCRVPSL